MIEGMHMNRRGDEHTVQIQIQQYWEHHNLINAANDESKTQKIQYINKDHVSHHGEVINCHW